MAEVAEHTKQSVTTVYRRIAEGALPAHKIGAMYRIDAQALAAELRRDRS